MTTQDTRRFIDRLNSAERKQFPMCTGLLDYAPDALAAIAHISYVGNEKHNKGEPLHHARGKSMDHDDCVLRHMSTRGDVDPAYKDDILAPVFHMAENAWRAIMLLQETMEQVYGLPLPRGARAAPKTDDGHSAAEIVALIAGENDLLCWHRECVLKLAHPGLHVDAEIAKVAYCKLAEAAEASKAAADRAHLVETFGPIARAGDIPSLVEDEDGAPLPPHLQPKGSPHHAPLQHTCAIGSKAPCAACDADSQQLTGAGAEVLVDGAGQEFDPTDG